jgi:DNA-directed RNA polymerase subunit RPC12/RpoP
MESVGGPVGISKANISEKKSRDEADSGVWATVERVKWKERILAIDQDANFYDDPDKPERLRAIRCSKCGYDYLVKYKNQTERFREHYVKCDGHGKRNNINPAANTNAAKFRGYFTEPGLLATLPVLPPPLKEYPCPGISAKDNSKIRLYLLRSSAGGGGG